MTDKTHNSVKGSLLMRKKLLITILAASMVMASITACDSKDSTGSTQAASGSAISSTASADYNVDDYVTKLGEYKGLEYTKVADTATEEQIQTVIKQFLSQHPEQIKEGTVKDGDTVNIDYCGKKDGVAFDGGTASGQALTIGSNSFIEGFESGLIGHKVGETVDLNLKFPDQYRPEGQAGSELNGAAVVFTVTINYIEGEAPKELTDELVSQYSDYKTVEEYKKSVKETLDEKAKENAKNSAESELLTQVVTNSSITSLPQSVHDRFYNQFLSYYQSMAAQYGMGMSSFYSAMKTTEDQMKSAAESYATNMGDQLLVIKAIAEKENITVSDDEYKAGVTAYFKSQGSGYPDEATFEKTVGKDSINEILLADKVVKFMMDNGKAVEKKASSSASSSSAK